MKYMECKFSKRHTNSSLEVKIGYSTISHITWFKYLGSIIQNEGKIERDVNYRIQSSWMKWKSALSAICNRKIPLQLNGKFAA